jgi:hypothetical protein
MLVCVTVDFEGNKTLFKWILKYIFLASYLLTDLKNELIIIICK